MGAIIATLLVVPAGGLLILAAMLAFGTAAVPREITTTARSIDRSDLPPVGRYGARDGASLAYRAYPAGDDRVAIVVHGSAEGGAIMHIVACTLQAAGITVYAPDIRGHGQSGRRGDIDYVGQIEDDLADLVAYIRMRHPAASLALVGFSSGGGFAARIAGGRYGDLFERYVLLSPTLPPGAPTFRANAGGWMRPYVARIIALRILRSFAIYWFDGLPVVAFAVAPGAAELTKTYSARLALSFAANADWRADFRRARQPMTLLVGGDDELNIAERYAPTLQPLKPDLVIEVIEGVDHISLLSDPRALASLRHRLERLRP
jgi:non-heme chloroperoxidase